MGDVSMLLLLAEVACRSIPEEVPPEDMLTPCPSPKIKLPIRTKMIDGAEYTNINELKSLPTNTLFSIFIKSYVNGQNEVIHCCHFDDCGKKTESGCTTSNSIDLSMQRHLLQHIMLSEPDYLVKLPNEVSAAHRHRPRILKSRKPMSNGVHHQKSGHISPYIPQNNDFPSTTANETSHSSITKHVHWDHTYYSNDPYALRPNHFWQINHENCLIENTTCYPISEELHHLMNSEVFANGVPMVGQEVEITSCTEPEVIDLVDENSVPEYIDLSSMEVIDNNSVNFTCIVCNTSLKDEMELFAHQQNLHSVNSQEEIVD